MKKIKFSEISHFTPKQKHANKISDEFKYTLYGGTMGPGKSYWLRWGIIRKLLKLFQKYKLQGIRAGLFCEDYPSLNDRHLSKIKYEFPDWLGTLNTGQHEYKIKSCYGGGVLAFRNLDDPSKYQSSEFAIVGVDELTKNKKETFDFLRTRLRFPPIKEVKFMAATNPGGIGHDWVKKYWMDGIFEPTEQEKDQFQYIFARPEDNPHLGDDYYKVFDGLPEKMRKAYKEGNWDVFEGQFFTEWNRDRHIIKPFEIPKTWKKFRAYDYGREKPACCLWCALDYDGNVYVYREFYATGLNADEQAKEIVRLSDDEIYEYSVADAAIFSPTGIIDKGGGETIAEVFARNGIIFIPTSKRRVDGWNMVHQYLFLTDKTEPKLKFFSTCANSIGTIPNLIHDEIKPEDVDSDGEDHCLVGDTLVDTTKGQFKIKDLVGKIGNIYTRFGVKEFRSVVKVGKRKVFKIELENGKNIILTGNHKVFTQNGWKRTDALDIRADELIQLDISTNLIVWKQKLFQKLSKSLVVKDIIIAGITFKEMVLDCIKLSGNIIMGRYHKDFTSTTKIMTNQIIEQQTLSYYPPFLTYPNTQKPKNIETRAGNILKNSLNQKLSNGINPKLVESGTVSTQKKLQKNGNGLQRIAQFVEKNIKPLSSFLTNQNTAIKIVKLLPCGEEEVYDLTVPSVEHFTVNGGLIVHNSADTIRYFLMSLHESKTAKPKTEIEKKLEQHTNKPFNFNDFYLNKC